ncbi:hypothetical protein TRIP_D300162 [uncultured Paludibacter sp.]|uniref:Uncharacterized protein n=1 Tax=uncultured Paludibacter sp. TaxID=497635 RepID=A0A653AC94_9BACT|nr:hypothetical protein TRIP_D300162 [uncultured Paludibacter sp.]
MSTTLNNQSHLILNQLTMEQNLITAQLTANDVKAIMDAFAVIQSNRYAK